MSGLEAESYKRALYELLVDSQSPNEILNILERFPQQSYHGNLKACYQADQYRQLVEHFTDPNSLFQTYIKLGADSQSLFNTYIQNQGTLDTIFETVVYQDKLPKLKDLHVEGYTI
jgi:hypothetical protein